MGVDERGFDVTMSEKVFSFFQSSALKKIERCGCMSERMGRDTPVVYSNFSQSGFNHTPEGTSSESVAFISI